MHKIQISKLDLSNLSGGEYVDLTALCEVSPQAVRADGCIAVAPTSTADIRRMQPTEIGSRPRSVLDVLGLTDLVLEYIFEKLHPRCSRCDCDAVPPKTLSSYQLPETGVIALSVIDTESEVPLQERAELLGSERVYVNGHLISVGDLTTEDGEPVLCAVAASDLQTIRDTSEHWFTRGGKELRIVHYASRAAKGHELGVIYNFWSCPECNHVLPKASRATAQEAPACTTCRGEGWLLHKAKEDGDRWQACRDCDGLGYTGDCTSYVFHGLKLSQILALSFEELRGLLQSDFSSREVIALLAEVCAVGLGACPLGALYDLCSPGERMLITVAQLRLARLEGATCLLDGAYGDFGELSNDHSSGTQLPAVRFTVKKQASSVPRFEVSQGASQVVIRDVYHGSLCIDEVAFPQGAVTAICGPVGSGKSLLLRIIEKRFSRRRKCGHLASFGNLQRCWFVDSCSEGGSGGSSLLSVLGLAKDLANEIAQTKRSKELGILASDLELPRSKYRCEQCHGGELTTSGSVCPSCQGALYDWRVAELSFLGSTVAEIVQSQVSQVATKLWAEESVPAVFGVLEELGAGQLALGTPAYMISPALRRVVKVASLLARIAPSSVSPGAKRRANDLANHLVLLDGPRVVAPQYEEIIGRLLHTLAQQGATILYASMPEGLESGCQSVVRLEWSARSAAVRATSSYLDQRYARESRVV
jgi:hypothetical protein